MFSDTLHALYPEWSLLHCSELSTEFVDKFYEYTSGLPAFMTRLAQVHQEYLVFLYNEGKLEHGTSTNTVQYLETVFLNQFQLYKTALMHLKSKDIREYENAIEEAQKAENTESELSESPKGFKSPPEKSASRSSPKAPLLAPVLGANISSGASIGHFKMGLKD